MRSKNLFTVAVGLAICNLRHKEGMAAKDLAHSIGESITALSKIENGKQRLTFELAIRLTVALNSSLDELAQTAQQLHVSIKKKNYVTVVSKARGLRRQLISQ